MQEVTTANPPEELKQQTYLNMKEACAYLRVSRSTVERMMQEGLIQGYRIYRQNILFIRAELDAYIEQHPNRRRKTTGFARRKGEQEDEP